jgi:hypothetical protein
MKLGVHKSQKLLLLLHYPHLPRADFIGGDGILADVAGDDMAVLRSQEFGRVDLFYGGIHAPFGIRDQLIANFFDRVVAEVFVKDGEVRLAVNVFLIGRHLDAGGFFPSGFGRGASREKAREQRDGGRE